MKKQYKILIVTHHPAFFSGFANVGRNLANVFIGAGYDVRFLDNMAYTSPTNKPYTEHKVYTENSRYDNRGKDTFKVAMDDFKPHIVLTIGDPWDSYYIPAMRGRYSFYWIAYCPIETTPIPTSAVVDVIPDLKSGNFNFSKYYNYIDKIIAYNKFGQTALQDLLPNNNNISYIHHGYNSEVFYLRYTSKSIVFKDSIPDDNCFIASTIARNNQRKALDSMLIGWTKFIETLDPQDKKNAFLYLHVPAESGGWDLDAIAKTIGCHNNILINREINLDNPLSTDNIANILSVSNVYLNTSRGEGFGLPIIEAMGCGTPAIVVDYAGPGAIANTIGRGGIINTIKVSEFVVDTLSGSMNAIIDTNNLALHLKDHHKIFKLSNKNEEITRSVSSKAESLYSWENIGTEWIKLVEDLDKAILDNTRFTSVKI